MNLNKFLKERRVILFICFFVFLATAAYAFYFRIKPAVDAWTYDAVAVNIASGHGFRLDLGVPASIDGVITYQGPFYQYFLAGIYKIFGHRYEPVWLIQALLRALSALMLFLICVKIFTPKSDSLSSGFGEEGKLMGWLAAAIFGFYPDLIEISAMLMTETLFIFLMILVLYIFIRYFERMNMGGALLLGAAMAVAILTRSTIGFFLPVFIFYFWKRRLYKQMILFLILIVLIMAPWTIRNYFIYHRFIPTMANFGYNLWVGNHAGGDGEGAVMPEYYEAIKTYGIIGTNYYAAEQFKNFVFSHPLSYIKLTAGRLMKYFSFIRPMGFWFYQSGWGQLVFVLSSALASVILFTFGFAGIFACLRRQAALKKEKKISQLIYLMVFMLLTCLAIIPILIETRYRLPIYPLMAIFAGFFIASVLIFKKEYLKYLVASFSLLFVSSAINAIVEYHKIGEKLGQFFN